MLSRRLSKKRTRLCALGAVRATVAAVNTPAESSEQRRARVARVVTTARAAGQPVPRGVKLIDFERQLTPREVAFGRSLEGVAREVLARHHGGAVAA